MGPGGPGPGIGPYVIVPAGLPPGAYIVTVSGPGIAPAQFLPPVDPTGGPAQQDPAQQPPAPGAPSVDWQQFGALLAPIFTRRP